MKTKKKKISVLMIILALVLVVYVISMCTPIFWTLMTSFKTNTEYTITPWPWDEYRLGNRIWLPFSWKGVTFDNYINAYKYFVIEVETEKVTSQARIYHQFINSILYSVGSGIALTGTSAIMAYATARFRYKFSNVIYTFVLFTIAMPIVGSMPSEIAVADALSLWDSFPGMWIMRCTFLNTYFLIFHAQFKQIPQDYTEAAKIDGANHLMIMLQIIFPLAWGTISAVFVLNFIAHWNDFQVPMIYLPSYPVAAYGMYDFENSAKNQISNDPSKLAGIYLLALPIIIFYAIFNKKLNVNLSVGGIKG